MRFALLGTLTDLSESGVDLTRYILVCTLTIVLVLVCAWLLRRFLAQNLRRRASQRSLAVMDVLPLGRKQKAVVLRCYDRSFLVGLGEREVTLLAELDPEAHEELEPSPPTVTPVEAPKVPVAAPKEIEQENFAEILASEAPLRQAEVKPGTRIPKEGILG